MASVEQYEAIYHCGKNDKAEIRIKAGSIDGGTYPLFKAGIPKVVDEATAKDLSARDDFTITRIAKKTETKNYKGAK